MQEFSYKIIEPNDDPKQAKIEKSGITAVFTLAQVEEHEATLTTRRKEMAAELEVEQAKMTNVENFHPEVKDMSGVLLTAATLYKESKTVVEKTTAKIAEYDAALKEYADEKAQIMTALGFVPTTITPNPDDNGNQAPIEAPQG
jgi:hypothetical protein